jgi:hypothetical protein
MKEDIRQQTHIITDSPVEKREIERWKRER